MDITEQSKKLFLAYAKDAANWSGTPLVGGNVGGNHKAQRGNLTQLKQAGLIGTFVEEGNTWLSFTDAGYDYALENGVLIYDMVQEGRRVYAKDAELGCVAGIVTGKNHEHKPLVSFNGQPPVVCSYEMLCGKQ